MSGPKPITIVGGGLAGLALGIGLRRHDIPVTVWEMGQYPRHRVCGEFVSGRGQEVLKRLGLFEDFLGAGAMVSRTAKFFLGKASSSVRQVEPPAFCLSRFRMDQLLAERFQIQGGRLRQNSRWQGAEDAEALVWTAGRRAQPLEKGWRWFGLKAHARNVALEADLEMHGSHEGYVGLCRLSEGEVNVCGLFRSRPGRLLSDRPGQEMLRGLPGTWLHSRLKNATLLEDSFCAVAGLGLRPRRAAKQKSCRLGDALTMIPPITGNGMSMAFEGAELAVEPLAAYARAEISWARCQQSIARDCDALFGRRLRWARCLQWLMFSGPLHGRLGTLALGSGWLWPFLFMRTR